MIIIRIALKRSTGSFLQIVRQRKHKLQQKSIIINHHSAIINPWSTIINHYSPLLRAFWSGNIAKRFRPVKGQGGILADPPFAKRSWEGDLRDFLAGVQWLYECNRNCQAWILLHTSSIIYSQIDI